MNEIFKRVGECDNGRFKMNGNLFLIECITTQKEGTTVVRFSSATDRYSVYEWVLDDVVRMMDAD